MNIPPGILNALMKIFQSQEHRIPIPKVELDVLSYIIFLSSLAVYFALGGGCSLEAGHEPAERHCESMRGQE